MERHQFDESLPGFTTFVALEDSCEFSLSESLPSSTRFVAIPDELGVTLPYLSEKVAFEKTQASRLLPKKVPKWSERSGCEPLLCGSELSQFHNAQLSAAKPLAPASNEVLELKEYDSDFEASQSTELRPSQRQGLSRFDSFTNKGSREHCCTEELQDESEYEQSQATIQEESLSEGITINSESVLSRQSVSRGPMIESKGAKKKVPKWDEEEDENSQTGKSALAGQSGRSALLEQSGQQAEVEQSVRSVHSGWSGLVSQPAEAGRGRSVGSQIQRVLDQFYQLVHGGEGGQSQQMKQVLADLEDLVA